MDKHLFIIVFLLLTQNLFSQESTYRNPVIAYDFPDPTVIRVGDTYYAAGTSGESAPPYRAYESKDLINWKFTGHLFKEMPEWTMGSYWAPELFYHNNTYYLYYTARRKSDRKSFIGVATTDDIHKGFTDHGMMIEWTNEAIDAFAIELDEKVYITWKAYGLDSDRVIQILGAELSDDGLSVKSEAFTLLEANVSDWEAGGIEGQCLVKHGDYIYMFYAGNSCCGLNCNYMTGVARAKNIKGPWERYSGNPILVGDEHWKCPGHGTLVATPDNRYFFMYHAYNAVTNLYAGRQGMIDEIRWDEKTGWPYFRYGTTPSLQAETPFPGTVREKIPDFVDDFSSSALCSEWTWAASQPKPELSIKNNKLELKGNDSPVGSFLGLHPRKSGYRLIATVEKTHSSSGICFSGGRYSAVGLSLRNTNVEFWKVSNGNRTIIETIPFKLDTASLFLEVSTGHICRFGYVNEEGDSVFIGEPIPLPGLSQRERLVQPGIHSKGLDVGRFDSVKIQYD
ncbi:MAG: glycoside hydrolase family 43 protein [Tannerellaceae bacterium]|jgi:beta-xylosidase|nr:glycoside hydrolase family 43 protein [Tannerellaceae bacterium]